MSSENKKSGVWAWVAGGAALILVVLFGVWGLLTWGLYPEIKKPLKPSERSETEKSQPRDWEAIAARGQFGDMFGLANALFSGMAFTALIASLALQRRELGLQREELKLAREEYAKQAGALLEQAATMERQARTELLAAQIAGVGSVLDMWQSALGSGELRNYNSANQIRTIDLVLETKERLETLLKKAESTPTPKNP